MSTITPYQNYFCRFCLCGEEWDKINASRNQDVCAKTFERARVITLTVLVGLSYLTAVIPLIIACVWLYSYAKSLCDNRTVRPIVASTETSQTPTRSLAERGAQPISKDRNAEAITTIQTIFAASQKGFARVSLYFDRHEVKFLVSKHTVPIELMHNKTMLAGNWLIITENKSKITISHYLEQPELKIQYNGKSISYNLLETCPDLLATCRVSNLEGAAEILALIEAHHTSPSVPDVH